MLISARDYGEVFFWGGGWVKHLIASDGVQERGDALVEEVKQVGEVDYECAAEEFYIVLLEDCQDLQDKQSTIFLHRKQSTYFARNRYGGIRAQCRSLVVDDDDEGFLTGRHEVSRSFSVCVGEKSV